MACIITGKYQRMLAASSLLAVFSSCAGAHRLGAPHQRADFSVMDKHVHHCASAPPSPHRWNAAIFSRHSSFYWFFSGESANGRGILSRVFPLANDAQHWKVKADVRYRDQTGEVDIQTTETSPEIGRIRISARLTPGRTSGTARVEESLKAGHAPEWQTADANVVIFADLPGEFWPMLERMHRCSEQAIATRR